MILCKMYVKRSAHVNVEIVILKDLFNKHCTVLIGCPFAA